MFIRKCFFAISVLALTLGQACAQSGRTPCDDLATFPFDPERIAAGVPYDRIRAGEAVRACANAVEDFPATGRLWFQYGRSLERANRISEAVDAYHRARREGHAGGANNLGELHRQGKGLARDQSRAAEYFREAAEAGYPEAAYNLASLLIKSGSYNRKEVEELLGVASNAGYPGTQALYGSLGARRPQTRYDAVFRPEHGTVLRREILDALRPVVEGKLYAPIEFRVTELKVAGDWAFAQVVPQRPGGTPIRVLDTPMAEFHKFMGDDVHTEAVLRRVRGLWRVVDYWVGSTDVWFTDWCDRLPKEIFRVGSQSGSCD
ncbi:sel1 repeat family protein [Microvirga sp. BT688]|uniref:tetratricopeptide repeat protein n=1 Tax=Microvirga sp. TaxID=1873136 RepID=UPI001684018A|nr:tetratricopeptide repeat protein [Microvirga sp.]MBD2745827.1 sel1 repeat family protein [Microvirga sp.]